MKFNVFSENDTFEVNNASIYYVTEDNHLEFCDKEGNSVALIKEWNAVISELGLSEEREEDCDEPEEEKKVRYFGTHMTDNEFERLKLILETAYNIKL